MRPDQATIETFQSLHDYLSRKGGEINTVLYGKRPKITGNPPRRLIEYAASVLKADTDPSTIMYESRRHVHDNPSNSRVTLIGQSALIFNGKTLIHAVFMGSDNQFPEQSYRNTGRKEVLAALGYIGSLFPAEARRGLILPHIPTSVGGRPYREWEQ